MKVDKTKILILVLVIALAIAVGYLAIGKWQGAKIREMQQAFQAGYNRGVNDAITTLYQQTNNCQTASITVGDAKRQLIDVACLRAS